MCPESGKDNYLDVCALIRSLQRRQGHRDCFQQNLADCDEPDCTWRTYCLENPSTNPDIK